MTLEEQKKLIAEKLMGWTIIASPEVLFPEKVYTEWISKDEKPTSLICRLEEWTPEKGGKDLTEVLYRVNWESLFYKLPMVQHCDEPTPEDIMIGIVWFQDPGNAPVIVKAIAETLEGK